MTSLACIFALAVLPGTLSPTALASAGQARAPSRRLQAVQTTEDIVVDGRLEESAWRQAQVATDFIQNEPHSGEPASERTEVRVLYNRDYLYFGVRAYDSQPDRLIARDWQKDFLRESGDSFQLILDTFSDGRNGYQFAVNPAGAKWDAQVTNEGRQINADWDAVWFVKTSVLIDGWSAEIAIPFKTLKFSEGDVQRWGINFQRNVRRRNENSFWSPLPRIYDLTRVSLAGTLDGLEGIKPGSNVRIKPALVAHLGDASPGLGSLDGDLGLDVKYGVTSGLSWDFTYNTDFSQAEADTQQINLTRFSLLFPEKREFFLENAGIFQFSGGADEGANTAVPPNDMLFFQSRRIGLAGEDTSAPGSPIPILGGTRLTGRAAGFEVGLLNIQQRAEASLPATNFAVVRLRRNVLANSDVGMMFNNKEEVDSPFFNRVVGVDANVRFSHAATLYSYLAKTFSSVDDSSGLAGRAAFHYLTSAWTVRGSYVNIQQDFRNEMGFVPRVGMRKAAGFLGRAFRPTRLRDSIRRIYPHGKSDWILDPQGRLESRAADYHFIIDFANGGTTEVGVNTFQELLVEPFVINRRRSIAIPAGSYDFYEAFWRANTDASRRVFGDVQAVVGPFYTGYAHKYTVGGTLRFTDQASTSFSYNHNNINLPEGQFKTTLLSLRGEYSFSTSAFLRALIQYNSDARQWSSNIRFNLIHRPLSDIFLVYNEGRQSGREDVPVDRAVILKFTYMFLP